MQSDPKNLRRGASMGAIEHDGLAVPGRVDLAHEPAFQLGFVHVHPATRQLSWGDRSETLEPRIMQVLVALYRAGRIVTRDELIARCWEGRIVSDDAINRVMSRIRHLASDIGQDSFRVETITKVGYRLDAERQRAPVVSPESGASSRSSIPGINRRALITGGVTLAAAGTWWLSATLVEPRINPEARMLFERGMEANRQGWIETGDQAKAYFEQAVAIDPEFADAWGALALQMHTVGLEGSDEVGVADRIRSAARRALTLDPNQREARVALVMLPRWFGRWAGKERAILSLLDEYPEFPALTSHYASFLAQVARFDEAVTMQERTIRNWPFVPEPRNQLIYALCGAGRLVEAEALSEETVRRWPRHPAIWSTRMALLTHSGRAEAALAFAADRERHPRGIEQSIPIMTATARALANRRPEDIEAAMAIAMQSVRADVRNIPPAMRLFSALGDRDRCFALLEAYLFRHGPLASGAHPLTPYTRIYTEHLFHPYTRNLWPDPRFSQITRKTGLEAYWESVGFVPSFRR